MQLEFVSGALEWEAVGDLRADDEEQEEGDDYHGEDDPAGPGVPG